MLKCVYYIQICLRLLSTKYGGFQRNHSTLLLREKQKEKWANQAGKKKTWLWFLWLGLSHSPKCARNSFLSCSARSWTEACGKYQHSAGGLSNCDTFCSLEQVPQKHSFSHISQYSSDVTIFLANDTYLLSLTKEQKD